MFLYGGNITDSTISGNSAGIGGGGISSTYFLPISVTRSTISDNTTDGFGGGIENNGNTVTVTDSAIRDNSARFGGGIARWSFFFPIATLTVTNSTISGNSAVRTGGGIYTGYDPTLIGSSAGTLSNGTNAGGVQPPRGNLFVTGTTIDNNTAAFGGGIWTRDGNVNVTSSTISGNQASGAGGGLAWFPFAYPGSPLTSAAIQHTTIAFNSAGALGGGVFIAGSQLTLDHAIVAPNAAAVGPELTGVFGSALDASFSLIGNSRDSGLAEAPLGMPDSNGNLIGGPINGLIDPKLGPLADNGGPTFTHALLVGSPALDAGDPAAIPPVFAPPFDQRGAPFARVFDGAGGGDPRIDIGAFELPPSSPAAFGDYNRNGLVDAADYVLWRKTLGQSVGPYEGADGNGSGIIDEADYTVWRARIGTIPGPLAPVDDSSPPMPLPSTGTAQAAAALDAMAVEMPIITSVSILPTSVAHEALKQPSASAARTTMRSVAPHYARELALIAQQGCGESPMDASVELASTNILAHDSVFEAWQNKRLADMGLDDALVSCRLSKDQ
jgi:hypothetical protein